MSLGQRRRSFGGLWLVKSAKSDASTFIATNNSEIFQFYNTSNAGDELTPEEIVDDILNAIAADNSFKHKYLMNSLFLIGAGAFGSVFRAVTVAAGPKDNPRYNEEFARYLMRVRKTNKCTRNALLDSYRDPHCLDLLAIKFEPLTTEDIENNSVAKINLIREFAIMSELHANAESRYSTVGIPLPIEFSYLGNRHITKDLSKVIVYDLVGQQNTFKETYIERNNAYGLTAEHVRNASYLSLELLGPNLDDWKELFMDTHGTDGKLGFSVQTTLKLMDQFLCRLILMHRKNIVHLDLKPDNICMGVGMMVNTMYLLDYGLSRICSDLTADITVGSRRYMSVGVLNLQPANYMMDIESWFYILLVLLADYVPWSDEVLSGLLNANEKEGGEREEKLVYLVMETKKKFWGDAPFSHDANLLDSCLTRIEKLHKEDVPDIRKIIREIFEHIRKMRADFYNVGCVKMNNNIRDEESDLFKRYKILRKLLLYPYDANFSEKGSCFTNDKDLIRRQNERKGRYQMLVYVEDGRNWYWDWDVWFEDAYGEMDDTANDNNVYGRKGPRPRHVSDDFTIKHEIADGVFNVIRRS